MFACKKAVKIAPEGSIIGSRGLAWALTGDFSRAIQDFELFIKWSDDDEEKAQQQGWVYTLKK
ncbi:tetratricopeptide repeat protein [Dapis sp. BLCC M229]|uniref:tetratricopeptide repeat protein n=1 Tax=Dapis sp. BLCC M229 TaxID=3400188 RepID=UPI003CF393E4